MSSNSSKGQKQERRKVRRRPILATFSVFCVVPRKGVHRLPIHDVSEQGIAFDLDTEGEDLQDFRVTTGETLDVQFYLNQSLFLPLSVKVIRVEDGPAVRKVGAELIPGGKGHEAFLSFVAMLDAVGEFMEANSTR